MKTFIADIIPKIERFSEKLDNLTLLTNQHWVVFDDIKNAKNVYIFRANNELLIVRNGKVEKAKWEYLGQNSILIDNKDESFLFRHGFFDENILALKLDSKEEYAFLVNETKYTGELNTLENIFHFLQTKYLNTNSQAFIEDKTGVKLNDKSALSQTIHLTKYDTPTGTIYLDGESAYPLGKKVYRNQQMEIVADGKYRIGFMWYIRVKSGKVIDSSII